MELFQKMLIGSAETAEKALNALLALFDEKNRKLPSMGRARRIAVSRDGKVETLGYMMAGVIYGLGHYRDEGGSTHIVVSGVTPWRIDVGLPPLETLGKSGGLEKIEGIDFGLFPGDTSDLIKGIFGDRFIKTAAAKN